MLGFVTGATRVRIESSSPSGGAPPPAAAAADDGTAKKELPRDLDLVAVYAATNHFVFGDVFLVPRSVRSLLLLLPFFFPGDAEREKGRERAGKKKNSPSTPSKKNDPKK